MSVSFDVPRRRVIRRTIVQAILPEWFAGARLTFAIAWKITTLGELIAAESGIGYMIAQEMQMFDLTGVLTWTLFFTLIILVFEYGGFHQVEKIVFDWREQASLGVA